MTDEEKDLIQRAQDIQRYTENRCNSLEERITELEKENKISEEIIIGEQQEINRLEKENTELKAEFEEIQNKVKKILLDENAEIGQLREVVGLDWCDKDYVEKLEKELAESKAQIEKMKDCSNCKHWEYSQRSLSYWCKVTNKLSDSEVTCNHCDKWELAE